MATTEAIPRYCIRYDMVPINHLFLRKYTPLGITILWWYAANMRCDNLLPCTIYKVRINDIVR